MCLLFCCVCFFFDVLLVGCAGAATALQQTPKKNPTTKQKTNNQYPRIFARDYRRHVRKFAQIGVYGLSSSASSSQGGGEGGGECAPYYLGTGFW